MKHIECRFKTCKPKVKNWCWKCRTKVTKMQGKGAIQVIDKGVDGARHMADKQAQDVRERNFKNKVKMVLDVIRIEMQEKGNQCAKPRYRKQCTKKEQGKVQDSRHRTLRCKSKMQIKGARHRLLQTCKMDSIRMQHKGAEKAHHRLQGIWLVTKIWGARHMERYRI